MSKERKRGPLSAEEQSLIRANLEKGPEYLAELLGRTEDTISRWIRNNADADRPEPGVSRGETVRKTIRHELKASLAWQQLAREFTVPEVGYFEEQYVAYVTQFRDDVHASENTQIMLAIKYEILMSRNLETKKDAGGDLGRLVKIRTDFLDRLKGRAPDSEEDRQFMLSLESQINAAKAAMQSASREFNDLETRHQALLKDLKATRDQRISKIESSKESFLGLIKKLQIEEEREAEGRQMALMARATEKEHRRLGGVITYDDGNQDQPVLSAETVEMLDGQK